MAWRGPTRRHTEEGLLRSQGTQQARHLEVTVMVIFHSGILVYELTPHRYLLFLSVFIVFVSGLVFFMHVSTPMGRLGKAPWYLIL